MAEQRTYSAGRVGLELNGVFVGPLVEVEGGEVFGAVAVEPGGQGQSPGKHIADIGYDPIVMRFGSGMGEALYAWIGDALAGKSSGMSGAVLMSDFDGRIQERLEFAHAVITGVAFDLLDGTNRGVWQITLTIQPEGTRRSKGGGSTPRIMGKARVALRDNFRVTLGELPTARVVTVQLPTATADVGHPVGDLRLPDPAAVTLSVSNLVLTVSAADGAAFLDAADRFLVEGHSEQADELNGKVELLGPNLKDVLFTFTLNQLGFVRASRERMGSAFDAGVTRRVRAEFYCESVGFVVEKGGLEVVSSGGAGQPASTPPATGTAGTDAVAQLSTALLGLLGSGRTDSASLQVATDLLADGRLLRPDPTLVAMRLQGTPTAAGSASGALQRADGLSIGRAWAQQQASLDELNAIGALDSADWDAVALPVGHSLLTRLVDLGAVAGDSEHPADLDRAAFVEGLVSGAAEVLREVSPHLGSLPPTIKENL